MNKIAQEVKDWFAAEEAKNKVPVPGFPGNDLWKWASLKK